VKATHNSAANVSERRDYPDQRDRQDDEDRERSGNGDDHSRANRPDGADVDG
jgi:hypothetical protein